MASVCMLHQEGSCIAQKPNCSTTFFLKLIVMAYRISYLKLLWENKSCVWSHYTYKREKNNTLLFNTSKNRSNTRNYKSFVEKMSSKPALESRLTPLHDISTIGIIQKFFWIQITVQYFLISLFRFKKFRNFAIKSRIAL